MTTNILLLDVDGVLKSLQGAAGTIRGTDWKEGVQEFVAWCQEQFHVVLILSSWQAHIHLEFAALDIHLPSLSWKATKTEGLAGLVGPGKKIVWVEDGWDAEDRARAEGLGITLVETHFHEPLTLTRQKIAAA